MVTRRIKYVEVSPKKREIIFNHYTDWHDFFTEYANKMFDLYGLEKYMKKWVYEKYKIKQDGKRAGSNDGSCLHTPQARKNQEKAWRQYIEGKRKDSEQVRKDRAKIIKDINNFLLEKGYYFKQLTGGYYSLKMLKDEEIKKEKKQ